MQYKEDTKGNNEEVTLKGTVFIKVKALKSM